ncbi:MAG: hypothetical protein NTV86_22275 [Planctomycetota bacterium]|nr:hypothetical protein [Planctomycetota bacterium]
MSSKPMGFILTQAFAAMFFSLSLTAGGCGYFSDNHGVIAERSVSPDRSLEAYVRGDDRMNFSSFSRLGSPREHVWVHWGSPGSPLKTRKLLVAKAPADEETSHSLAGDVHLAFSPDSRRLAIITPDAVKVVDLITGRQWDLTGPEERVSSLAWASNTDVVYASHTYLAPPREEDDGQQLYSNRTFWRQPFDRGAMERQMLYHETRVAAGANTRFAWPLESFSPTGDRVIFRTPIERGHFVMLDLAGRRGFGFGTTSANSQVWWKDDGSRALVSLSVPDKYLLVDAFGGRTTDVSAKVSAVMDRERRWRRNPSFDRYGEMQSDAVRSVLWQGTSDDLIPVDANGGLIRPLSKR